MIFKLLNERLVPASGEHVKTRLFVGEDEDHLAQVGELTFRVGEWQLFGAALKLGAAQTHGHLKVVLGVLGVALQPKNPEGPCGPMGSFDVVLEALRADLMTLADPPTAEDLAEDYPHQPAPDYCALRIAVDDLHKYGTSDWKQHRFGAETKEFLREHYVEYVVGLVDKANNPFTLLAAAIMLPSEEACEKFSKIGHAERWALDFVPNFGSVPGWFAFENPS